MRWRYPDLADRAEARRRNRVLKKIDAWWAEFTARADDCDALFRRRKRWDLPSWMRQHLGAVSPHLMWEFGPGEGDGHRLIITPESRHELRPLGEVVLSRAPTIPGWSFAGFRPAEDVETALQSVTAKGGKDVAKARVQAAVADDSRIDLTVTSPDFSGKEADDDHRDALWLIEGLLGEEALHRWVGVIRTRERSPGRKLGLAQVRPTVERMIGNVRAALPGVTCAARRAESLWTQYQMNPDRERDDYPGRSDMIVASTMVPEAWQAAHAGSLFWSGRFSRCGETFAYLKIETGLPLSQALQRRHAIEDAVQNALAAAGVGALVGNAIGIVHVYTDMALTDVPRAIALLREEAARLDLPRHSWLLFDDADLGAEWAGLRDDTPAPPEVSAT